MWNAIRNAFRVEPLEERPVFEVSPIPLTTNTTVLPLNEVDSIHNIFPTSNFTTSNHIRTRNHYRNRRIREELPIATLAPDEPVITSRGTDITHSTLRYRPSYDLLFFDRPSRGFPNRRDDIIRTDDLPFGYYYSISNKRKRKGRLRGPDGEKIKSTNAYYTPTVTLI